MSSSFTVASSSSSTSSSSRKKGGSSGGGEIAATLIVSVIEIGIITIGSYYFSKWLSEKVKQSQLNRGGDTAENKSRLQDILDRRAMEFGEEPRQLPPLNDYEAMIAQDVVDPAKMTNTFADVGGMNDVKKELWELAVLPLLRPDLFSTSSPLVRPTRGILLYGKPGTGKTMLAKAMAKEAKATFIAVKLSKIMDKWFGESNKLIAATFSLAEKLAPSIVFIDEIDTFLNPRDGLEGSASGAIKSEFLTLWDGLTTAQDLPVLVLGATNRPHNVDPAILRRLPRAFCIGLPNADGRLDILQLLLKEQKMTTEAQLFLPTLSKATRGYSGSDLKELCRAAAMEPIRELMSETSRRAVMGEISVKQQNSHNIGPPPGTNVRGMTQEDLIKGMDKVKRTGQVAHEYGATETHPSQQSQDGGAADAAMAKQFQNFMRLLSDVHLAEDEEDYDSDNELPTM